MNLSFKKVLCLCCLVLASSMQAQVSQDLIDKAKAAGLSEAQIQQELAKRLKQGDGSNSNSQTRANGTDPAVSDRVMPKLGNEKDKNKQKNGQGLGLGQDQELDDEELLYDEDFMKAERREKYMAEKLKNMVFGREIFSNKKLSFTPELNIPTPKDYVLSAGDELLINVWGDSELNLKLKVSPDGTILVPNLGPVSVSGLTITSAEVRLRQELSQIMSSISSTGEGNTFVSVSLSQIRSMKVNIVGEVVNPGTYTLPSLATLFNALYAAGGVNDIGSLRNIRVFRNSKEIANLDVYDYLLNGKYTTNVRLEENDMIIVGPYEQLAVVRGKVKRNRIFEMRKGETLQQLLDMAGGFTGDAYKKDVQVKRKSETRYQIATVTNDKFASFIMQDGDSLQVDSVIAFYENRLRITGAVWRPGEYELGSSIHTVKQLVQRAGGLKGDEFAGRAQITRLNEDFTSTVVAVDIRGILNGSVQDVELRREDELSIPSLFDLREPYTIRVCGAVNYEDTVMPYRYNLTVEDAIMMGGGLKESAAEINVEVARRLKNPTSDQNQNRTAEIYTFSLNDGFMVNPSDTVFTLEPFDEVYVRFSPGYQEQQVVKVNGEITFAGSYVLATKNARLSDVVAKAGSVTPQAYVRGASLKRKMTKDELKRMETLLELSTANKNSRDSIGMSALEIKDYSVGIDLEKALARPGGIEDVVLRDGDELYIPQLQSTVKMSGAVTYPNSVTFTKGMTVRECLSQSGGYNDMSRKYPIVVYMNGKVATTKRTGIFFKRYPKVEPGCEIIVPTKSPRNGNALAEILSVGSSITSMAAMVTSIMTNLK